MVDPFGDRTYSLDQVMKCDCSGCSQLSGLGQSVCTTVMCSEGKANVQQMMGTFNYFKTVPSFNRARFEHTVTSIETAFDNAYTSFSEWIPFNPSCCAVQQIGLQAVDVTNQMLESMGNVRIPRPPTTPDSIGNLIALGGIVLGLMFISNVKPLLKK